MRYRVTFNEMILGKRRWESIQDAPSAEEAKQLGAVASFGAGHVSEGPAVTLGGIVALDMIRATVVPT